MEPVERIFLLADARYPEQRDFANAVGVAPSIISQWRNGITKSYERRLPKIAEVLGTTVGYLLTGENEKNAPAIREDDEDALDRELISRLVELTPEELAKVDAFVQGLKAGR